jgi:hypothetical protein
MPLLLGLTLSLAGLGEDAIKANLEPTLEPKRVKDDDEDDE